MTSSSHFTQVFIGDRSFIFVLPVIRMCSKEVILSICKLCYKAKVESGLELKILKKIALISTCSPENDQILTDDLLNKYR